MGADPKGPVAGGQVVVCSPAGQYFVIDLKAKLEEGCTVAVFWHDYLVKVGRLRRRVHPRRRLAIDELENGKSRVSRAFGLKEAKAYRVAAILQRIDLPGAE
jgi:hypothetical protein